MKIVTHPLPLFIEGTQKVTPRPIPPDGYLTLPSREGEKRKLSDSLSREGEKRD
jgi:hypothetical protein